MVANKFPGPVNCPHCGNTEAKRLPRLGDYSEYRCPACGDFRISGTQEQGFDTGLNDPTKARFVVDGEGRRWLVP
jgi:predicted RNA-binding Zn-ribbon protein involved in translation (DUF1610 family)